MNQAIGPKRCCEECAHYDENREYVGEYPHGGEQCFERCRKRADEKLWTWRDDSECPDFEWRLDR